MEEIQATLAARTPEEIAADDKAAEVSWQKLYKYHEEYQATHRRIVNKKKYDDFLSFAELMRKYTKLHDGKISIRAEEFGLGVVEMFFDFILHSDFDIFNSHFLFGKAFMRYKDTYIGVKGEGIFIQIIEELYDTETI
jgi:hypothetical protein